MTRVNARTEQVLALVAATHIASAKPVPSALVAQQLSVSSATIRNEFSLLEHEGYLLQPHTSAGRIPSTRGYRHYARRFLPPKALPKAQRVLLAQSLRGAHGDGLLERIASVTADLSGYAVVVTLSGDDAVQTLEIHLSHLSQSRILAVVVLQNGLVRQLVLELDPSPSERDLREAEASLRHLSLPLREMPRALSDIASRAESEVARTYHALAEAWPQLRAPRIFSHGLKHLFAEPESADPGFVRQVLERVESPVTSAETLALAFEEPLALISAQLPFGSAQAGLFLFGPLRMRYPETLMIARGVSETVAQSLN